MTYTDPPVTQTSPTSTSNGLATAGFVLGLLALLGCWIPVLNFVAIVLGVVGVILAAIGLSKSKRTHSGKGLALAGLILGALGIVLSIVINVAFVDAVDEAVDDVTKTEVTTTDGAEPEDSDVGSTRDSPAPMNSAISGDNWTVKINSVEEIGQDSLGQKAESGSVLIQINLTATYTGDDEQGETPWATIKYVGTDGSSIDSTDSFHIADDSFDSLKTVYEGGTVTGDQILQVPADWKSGVLAVSPGMLSDDTFIAVK